VDLEQETPDNLSLAPAPFSRDLLVIWSKLDLFLEICSYTLGLEAHLFQFGNENCRPSLTPLYRNRFCNTLDPALFHRQDFPYGMLPGNAETIKPFSSLDLELIAEFRTVGDVDQEADLLFASTYMPRFYTYVWNWLLHASRDDLSSVRSLIRQLWTKPPPCKI
jgi:hypothetical protein